MMKKMMQLISFALITALVMTGCNKEKPSSPSESVVPPVSSSVASRPDISESQNQASSQSASQTPAPTPTPTPTLQPPAEGALPSAGFYDKNLGSAGAISLQVSDVTAQGFQFVLDAKGVTLSGRAKLDQDNTIGYKDAECTLVFQFDGTSIFINETEKYNENVDLSGNYQPGK